MTSHDEFVAVLKDLGFESEKEWSHMMAAVDLTDAFIALRFEVWKANDGSKAGLQTLVEMSAAIKEMMPVPKPVAPSPPQRTLSCPMCEAGIPTREVRYYSAIKDHANIVIEIKDRS